MRYLKCFIPNSEKFVFLLDTAQDTLFNFLKYFFIGFRGVSIEVCSSHIGAVLVSVINRHFYFYISRNKEGSRFLKFRVVVPVPSELIFSDADNEKMLCFASGKYFATAEGYTISDILYLSKERISVATCLIYYYLIDAGNFYAKYFLEKVNEMLPEQIINNLLSLVVSNAFHHNPDFQVQTLPDGILFTVKNFREKVVKAFFMSFLKSRDIYMAILNPKETGFFYHSELHYRTENFPVLLKNVRAYLDKSNSNNLCKIFCRIREIDNNNFDKLFSFYAD